MWRETGQVQVLQVRVARRAVPLAALAAFLLRLPGLTQPARADEAGFTLVARAWDPAPDSVYGPYFVDRPPLVIAVYRLADLLGTPSGVRLLGALACAATVLLVAASARIVAGPLAARWCAVLVASLTSNPFLDPVSAKGELLALPLIALAAWCALRVAREPTAPLALAAASGLAGSLALGLKQNLAGGLVLAVVLLVTARLTGDLPGRRTLRALLALTAGAAVPPLAALAWAVLSGVGPATLWYTLYGFRADASRLFTTDLEGAAYERLNLLLLAALAAGIATALGAFVTHLRHEWRADRPATAAVAAMLLVDVVGLLAGGSYWRDYLFPLVPGVGLAAALLATRPTRHRTRMRTIVGLATVSTAVSYAGWVVLEAAGALHDDEPATGAAVGASAARGDTLVVYGGRADLQLASGLPSPYRHLWSLPMRTLDPERQELRALLSGPEAPTWLVEYVDLDTWDDEVLERVVDARYQRHGTGCSGEPVHLLRGLDRPPLEPDCS